MVVVFLNLCCFTKKWVNKFWKQVNIYCYKNLWRCQRKKQKNFIIITQQKKLVVTTYFEFRYVPKWQLLSKYLQ
jgi:hypothetical protein